MVAFLLRGERKMGVRGRGVGIRYSQCHSPSFPLVRKGGRRGDTAPTQGWKKVGSIRTHESYIHVGSIRTHE